MTWVTLFAYFSDYAAFSFKSRYEEETRTEEKREKLKRKKERINERKEYEPGKASDVYKRQAQTNRRADRQIHRETHRQIYTYILCGGIYNGVNDFFFIYFDFAANPR